MICLSREFVGGRSAGDGSSGEHHAQPFEPLRGKLAVGIGLFCKVASQSQVLLLLGKALEMSGLLKILCCQSHVAIVPIGVSAARVALRAGQTLDEVGQCIKLGKHLSAAHLLSIAAHDDIGI
jgi:hypothetical protein